MHIGVAHHLGWAILVSAGNDFEVVDRRRIELVDQGLPAAPIHHLGGTHEMHGTDNPLDDDDLEELVAKVRSRAVALTNSALDNLIDAVGSIQSISLRDWPDDFPNDIATKRQAPYESQADSVMYREVFAEVAKAHGWAQHRFDAKTVEADATAIVLERAEEVLHGPRKVLGAPWNKDHRTALAAIIVASG